MHSRCTFQQPAPKVDFLFSFFCLRAFLVSRETIVQRNQDTGLANSNDLRLTVFSKPHDFRETGFSLRDFPDWWVSVVEH